jgi:hypothetical protein
LNYNLEEEMKTLFSLVFIFILLISGTLTAEDNNSKNYDVNNIVGLSYSTTQIDNKAIAFIEIRDQICYDIKDFPIIPYFEPNIFIGLSKEKPNIFVSVLFGMRKNLFEIHGLTFSIDMGSGIATGLKDKNNAGVIGRFGADITYKNFVLRCVDINLISGFPFKGTASLGMSYKF